MADSEYLSSGENVRFMVLLPFSRTASYTYPYAQIDNPPLNVNTYNYHIIKDVRLHKGNDKGMVSESSIRKTERRLYGSCTLLKVLEVDIHTW